MMRRRKKSNGVKKKRAYKKASECETGRSGAWAALPCLGIGVCLVLLCSCLSFDIGDWPSKFAFPHNAPPVNWCGSIGAFCAYYLLYYVGPGVFVILASAICFLVAKIAHRRFVFWLRRLHIGRPASRFLEQLAWD